MENVLQQQLEKVETLAKGRKLGRLAYSPGRYCYGILYRQLWYRLTRKGKRMRTNTFWGDKMQVLLPAGMDIYLLGAKTHDSELRLTKYLIQVVKPGDTFLDVGAHFGFFSLLAAHLVKNTGGVWSIEASKMAFEILKGNTLNEGNVHIFHCAAAAENGSVDFYEHSILYSEYNSTQPAMQNNVKAEKVTVPAQSLDVFLAKNDCTPDVIKIDVEGGELDVLKGAVEYLKKNAPIVVFEYILHDKITMYMQAVDFIRELGYFSFLIDEKGVLVPIGNIEEEMRVRRIVSENVVFKKE